MTTLEKQCCTLTELPPNQKLNEMSLFFKTFGDTTRLKILFAMQSGEMCVSHLAKAVDLNQTTLSHQLAKLHQNRLVKKRREGKMMYYSLDDKHVNDILQTGLNHINHIEAEGGMQ